MTVTEVCLISHLQANAVGLLGLYTNNILGYGGGRDRDDYAPRNDRYRDERSYDRRGGDDRRGGKITLSHSSCRCIVMWNDIVPHHLLLC